MADQQALCVIVSRSSGMKKAPSRDVRAGTLRRKCHECTCRISWLAGTPFPRARQVESLRRTCRVALRAATAVASLGALIGFGYPAASAQDVPATWRGCSNATLKGLYSFAASGNSIVGGVAQPKAVAQFTRFSGNGTFAVPAGTTSLNGVISHIPPSVPGTYFVRPDCTGTYQFAPPNGPTFDLFVAPNGSKYWLIQTGPGAQVQVGSGERLSL